CANLLSRIDIRFEPRRIGRLLRARRDRSQCHAGCVVDELNVNVLVAKANAHPWPLLCAADFLANAPFAQLPQSLFFLFLHLLFLRTNYWTVLPSFRTTCSSL